MNSKFQIYEDNAGKWRWRLRAINGKIIADSGQGYTRRSECRNAIERLCNEINDNSRIIEVKNA